MHPGVHLGPRSTARAAGLGPCPAPPSRGLSTTAHTLFKGRPHLVHPHLVHPDRPGGVTDSSLLLQWALPSTRSSAPEETLAPRAWCPAGSLRPNGRHPCTADVLRRQNPRKSQSCPPSSWNLVLSKSSGLGIKRRASEGLGGGGDLAAALRATAPPATPGSQLPQCALWPCSVGPTRLYPPQVIGG